MVTVTVNGDPTRTQDHAITARSPWAAGWLYRYLHPGTTPIAVRPIPEHRS